VVGTEPRTVLFTVNGATLVAGCMRVINFLRRSVDVRVGWCCLTNETVSFFEITCSFLAFRKGISTLIVPIYMSKDLGRTGIRKYRKPL
jgi:hypothetical protein